MADETSSNPGVGARAWQNSVVRATIIRHANNATLAKLLRVDKETFQLGARELYKYVPDYKVFKERLSSLQNSMRYHAYSLHVRHIGNMSSSDVHLITLRLCFPQLRSIELYTGSTLKWDLDSDGKVIRILYTEINWDRDTCSAEAVARARKLVPEDWKLLIRPDGVYIHDRASIEEWKRSITDQSTIMPESLTIGSLDPATLSRLLTFAQDQPCGLPIAELTIDDVYAYRTAEGDNTLMPLNDILAAFAGRADSVILYKRHLTLESMQELRLEMAALPTMKLCLDPWSPSFDRSMRD